MKKYVERNLFEFKVYKVRIRLQRKKALLIII